MNSGTRLVGGAGRTLGETAGSVQRVVDIGEPISRAASAQADDQSR